MKRVTGAWAGIAGVLLLGEAPLAWGCAPMEEIGAPPIKVNTEAAVIVWDEAKRTEHFIRRASFDSSGRSMGFIVPTPSTPTLTAASDNVFAALDTALEPRTETRVRTGLRFDWLLLPDASEPRVERPTFVVDKATRASRGRQQTSGNISVVTTSVGGYTATILPARNERELERWMRRNNFKTGPGTQAWLKPYVQRGWTLTAFTIKPGMDSTELSPVRLSFKTDKPYYPYREPAAARQKGNFGKQRTLKVYFVGHQRPDGAIGQSSKWPGEARWSAALPYSERTNLVTGTGLNAGEIPAQARLTVFQDNASPRPGTDEVFFRPSPDQSKLAPEPIIQWSEGRKKIPLELFVLGIVSVCVFTVKQTNRHIGRSRKTDK